MTPDIDAAELATPDPLARYLAESDLSGREHTQSPSQSVRTAQHEGHRITLTTTYDLTVDGTSVPARLHVGDGGTLYSPGLPYHQFTSALDAVRALMSAYPHHFGGGS
ncbi:hypothetical protein ABZ802_10865 [Streptomyces sp. NPDC047737]|jgi:hypothetical protein|uniref:hypothetical protein n=1 Tax=unclassified Streptomyces TaxID=2593676 RepID=UPI0033F890E7